jgi:hypothetical protein
MSSGRRHATEVFFVPDSEHLLRLISFLWRTLAQSSLGKAQEIIGAGLPIGGVTI